MIRKEDIIPFLPLIFGIFSLLLNYKVGIFLFGMLTFVVGFSYLFLRLLEIAVGRRQIDLIVILQMLLPFFGYALMKYSFYGVVAETLGQKGVLPTLIRIGQLLLFQGGSVVESLGVLIGAIGMATAIGFAIYTSGNYLKGRMSESEFKTTSAIVGLTFVFSFFTIHLAQAGFGFPVVIMGVYGAGVGWIPFFVITMIASILLQFLILSYMLSKHF